MDLGLKNRVFVVTAASGGLGLATAQQLVAEGACVVLVARRENMLAEAVAQLGQQHATSVTADLAEPATAERICRQALDSFGRLDGALISVGGPPAGTALETTDEQWHAAFDSVFLAGLRVNNAVVRLGTADDLAIAWVLSGSVKQPVAGLATSNGLRPGLAMLIKQLADELGPDGTRVLGLMPGRIDTERVQHLDSLAQDPAANRKALEQTIALRRYGQPAEFARVATFLLSPAASYVTGSVIAVEGGSLRSL